MFGQVADSSVESATNVAESIDSRKVDGMHDAYRSVAATLRDSRSLRLSQAT
jgi:hypothetical protein